MEPKPTCRPSVARNASINGPMLIRIVFQITLVACLTLALVRAPAVYAKPANSLAITTSKGTFFLPRDQTLMLLSGESNNPRSYDPATSFGDRDVFSGLVSFNPQMQITPDLAQSWDIDASGIVYTFHLRMNARFHDGRPFSAADVIYSWNRAADPAIGSNTVLTYLGDIAGIQDRAAGKADHISGLQALDDHTLKVTLDAPKPYFLMKLTYGPALIVEQANVQSGPDWYKKPIGTGPFKLMQSDPGKLLIYQRNDDFYLTPPALQYIVYEIFAGLGMQLYEAGQIDISGVSSYDIARVQNPTDPLHKDLLQAVSTCTSFITLDSSQPPFDDPLVRQAFSLAIDRQQYIDIALRGQAIPARGLYPPALPGYDIHRDALQFNPALAKQKLAASKYAKNMPTIVFSTSGFGSYESVAEQALVGMWEKNLGVSVQVENLEPDKYGDMIYSNQHGQLVFYGWCADYLDPENFADALFHSGTRENIGHYSNPDLDTLLNKARSETNVTTRIQMYQKAEQILVDDSAALFLTNSLEAVVVKPYVKGYVLTPVAIPILRYVSIDASKLP